MSATQDKTQKVTFVYSNLYQLYRKGQDQPAASAAPAAVIKSANVLKAESLSQASAVRDFSPAQFIGKRIPKPEVVLRAEDNRALESLKKNLSDLNDLHSRLRFMLKELEELVKE